MTDFVITVSEENLYSNHKLQTILYECQNQGLISIERVESSPYTLKLPKKSSKEPREAPLPEDFVKAVKSVINYAARQNGQKINTIDGSVVGCYYFWLNATKWCVMMEKLLERHRDLIEAVLEKRQRADSVNLLASFIGAILDKGLFQKPEKIRKVDIIHSFTEYYGEAHSSVKTQLSSPNDHGYAFNDLVYEAVEIAKEICN